MNKLTKITVTILALCAISAPAAPGVEFFNASDITNITVHPGHGSSTTGMSWDYGDQIGTGALGEYWEKVGEGYSDGIEYATQTHIRAANQGLADPAYATQTGDHHTVTFNNGTAYVYFPYVQYATDLYLGVKSADPHGYYYVNTYSDAARTVLAYEAPDSPTPSPTSSVTPTPTPVSTPAPTASPQPTATPTPSPVATRSPTPVGYKTPTPTPTCAPSEGLMFWNVKALGTEIDELHSPEINGWRFIVQAADNPSITYGDIYDSANTWHDYGRTDTRSALAIRVDEQDAIPAIRPGDHVTFNLDLDTGYALTKVYFPAVVTDGMTFYVGQDRNTYYDRNLCDLAQVAPPPTTPVPAPSPSPLPGTCFQAPHDFTADETVLWEFLQENWTAVEEALRSINSACLARDFVLAARHLGAHIVSNVHLTDYLIANYNLQTGAVDGRTIDDRAIGSQHLTEDWSVDSAFPYNRAIDFVRTEEGDPDSPWEGIVVSSRYRIENVQEGGNAQGLRIARYDSAGETRESTAFYVGSENGYVGIYNVVPGVPLEVGGGFRARGQARFDKSVICPWSGLTADSGSPSVRNGMNFYTQNENTTTYTNFLGGVDGQRITILVLDDNCRWDNQSTSNIWLCGDTTSGALGWVSNGTYWTCESGTTLDFALYGQDWCPHPCKRMLDRFDAGSIPAWPGAQDDFESGGNAGGSGWSSTWVTSLATPSTENARETYAALIRGTGYGYRSFSCAAIPASVTVAFWYAKGIGTSSFNVYYGPDASTWNALTTESFTPATTSFQEASFNWSVPTAYRDGTYDEIFIKFVNSDSHANYVGFLDDISISE